MARRIVKDDGPHPIDVFVGRRVKERRTLEGMSQRTVATNLGLTFQQLRKYEIGTNRISASRLYELAQLLGVPVSYFYEGMEEGKGAPSLDEVLALRETLELVRAYYAISDREVRDKIRGLVKAAAKLAQPPTTSRKLVRRKSKAAPKKPAAKQRTKRKAR